MTTLPASSILSVLFRGLVLFACLSAAALQAQSNYTSPYYFTTLAGATSMGSADGSGDMARFLWPDGAACDASGNLYVADTWNQTIRKITPAGTVSTLAGLPGLFGSSDGSGTAARFNLPRGLAVDATGNLYVADSGNSTIRKITPAGVVTTLAGLAGAKGVADGVGSSARFQNPRGLAWSTAGNLYVADDSGDNFIAGNKPYAIASTIRVITPAGAVSTVVGGLNTDHYIGSDSYTKTPFQAIVCDVQGNIVVSQTEVTFPVANDIVSISQSLLRFTPDGKSTTIATTNGAITDVQGTYGIVNDLAFDSNGILLAAKSGQIVKIDLSIPSAFPSPSETILAGGSRFAGYADGPATQATFGSHLRLAPDRNGNTYVADTDGNNIRKITAAGSVTTVAGLAALAARGSADGSATTARFNSPNGVCTDSAGNLYVTENSDATVRKITPAGIVTTLAGQARAFGNSDGAGSSARFSLPAGITIDRSGNLYVADTGNRSIRKITASGETTTFAGTGHANFQDGLAEFNLLSGIAIDGTGYVYITDHHSIRKISPTGDVTNLAGEPFLPGADDGTGRAARFNYPYGITIDNAGNLYVSDLGNSTIRKITPAGAVTTVAGTALISGSKDGIGPAAQFNQPWGITIDSNGVLFVNDWGNRLIRKITPAGVVSTVAGFADVYGNADGLGSQARLHAPVGITCDAMGNLYVTNDTAISKGRPGGAPIISTQPLSQTVTAGNSVQLSVIAGGVPAPTYQWYFNGGTFSGATGSTLSFSNARSTDAGDHTVIVTNSLGSVTSSKATLTVSAAPAPTPTPTPSPANGGGSIEAWFVLALFALSGAGRWLAQYKISRAGERSANDQIQRTNFLNA